MQLPTKNCVSLTASMTLWLSPPTLWLMRSAERWEWLMSCLMAPLGMAWLCCDARRQVRMQALTYLQRALLVHDLQTLDAVEWESCFNKVTCNAEVVAATWSSRVSQENACECFVVCELQVLFPLLTKLLENISPADVGGMEETRMRACTLLSKVTQASSRNTPYRAARLRALLVDQTQQTASNWSITLLQYLEINWTVWHFASYLYYSIKLFLFRVLVEIKLHV